MLRNLLATNFCLHFSPTFDNRECLYYQYAENDLMDQESGICGFCKRPGAYRCVADVTRTIPLSHSSSGDFLICHYYYMLKKLLGIEMRPPFLPNPVKAGKLWDTIIQKHYGATVNIKQTIDEYEMDPYVVAKVRALYHAYKELELTVDPGYTLQAEINLKYDIVIPPSSFLPSISIGKESINLWQDKLDQSEDKRTWKFPLQVRGFYDWKYNNCFYEDKLSGKPEWYLDPFFIQSQNSTYFMADPKLEYCIQRVVLFPQHKELKKKEETPDQMYKRVYSDVLSRPSLYFIGYDRAKKMYGRKFWRGEFDLQAAEDRYRQITIELLACRWSGNWYKNFKSCNNVLPSIPCNYQTVCKTGNVSENMYKIREKL